MLAETIANLHLAIVFNIAAGCMELVGVGLLIWSTMKMRKAMRLYQEAASTLSRATGNVGNPPPA